MSTANPPKIYAILNYETCGDPRGQLTKLLTQSFQWIQIRAKTLPKSELITFIDEALKLRDKIGPSSTKIIVNDYADIAVDLGADGVHLGQEDLGSVDIQLVRKQLGANAILGLSTHSLSQAVAADSLPLTYIAVGPIFHSSTKSGHAEPIGVDELKRICEQVSKPVVAIGGINKDNESLVYSAGASSVALIAALEKL